MYKYILMNVVYFIWIIMFQFGSDMIYFSLPLEKMCQFILYLCLYHVQKHCFI